MNDVVFPGWLQTAGHVASSAHFLPPQGAHSGHESLPHVSCRFLALPVKLHRPPGAHWGFLIAHPLGSALAKPGTPRTTEALLEVLASNYFCPVLSEKWSEVWNCITMTRQRNFTILADDLTPNSMVMFKYLLMIIRFTTTVETQLWEIFSLSFSLI